MAMEAAYVGTLFTLNGIAIIMHILGLYSILSQKGWSRENQNILLLNLTIIELLLVITITIQGANTIVYGQDSLQSHIPQYCEFSQWMTLFLLMIYVSIDRLLRAMMGVNYNRKITAKFTKIAATSLWLLGFSTVFPLYLIGIHEALDIMYNYVFVTFDVVVIVVAVIAYSTIAFLLRRSRNAIANGSETGGGSKPKTNWRPYLVAGLIIFTFFICYAVPDWSLALNPNYPFAHEYSARILWALGLISDPVIYILLITKNRDAVLKLFGREPSRLRTESSAAGRLNREKKVSSAQSIISNETIDTKPRSNTTKNSIQEEA